MKPKTLLRVATLLLAAGLTLAAGWLVLAQQSAERRDKAPAAEYQLSGPYAHDNLTVFLIHGKDQLQKTNFLTLAEALEKKLFVIHETQSVNQLSAENLSPDVEVLILSGDILKGGQQDRIAQHDRFIPPKSGKVPLNVFCVELTAPRWMAKLDATNGTFMGNPGQIATNDLRLANRYYNNQAAVWKNVAEVQKKLSHNAMVDVKAKESDSSLALSLQAKEVRAASDKYVQKLTPAVKDKKDVIGYAFAINGKVYAVDIYGSSVLFHKIWPRLLQATATEAFADLQKNKKFEPVTAQVVRTFMAEADKGKETSADVGKDVRQCINDGSYNVRFESREKDKKGLIRSNYLKK